MHYDDYDNASAVPTLLAYHMISKWDKFITALVTAVKMISWVSKQHGDMNMEIWINIKRGLNIAFCSAQSKKLCPILFFMFCHE